MTQQGDSGEADRGEFRATGEFRARDAERAFLLAWDPQARASLRWGALFGVLGIGLGVVFDLTLYVAPGELLLGIGVRTLTMLSAALGLLLAVRASPLTWRPPLIAGALLCVGVGFLTIRLLYGDRGVQGVYLLSITGLLVADFFFFPSRLWWQLATALGLCALGLVGAVWLLGQAPKDVFMAVLVYGVITVVGWRFGQLGNRDRRRLYSRQLASDAAMARAEAATARAEAATARAVAAEATARRLFQRAPTAMVVVHAQTGRILASNDGFDRLVALHSDEGSLFDRILRDHRGKLTGALADVDRDGPIHLTLHGLSEHTLALQAHAEDIEFEGAPGVLLSLVDVSPLRAREAALQALAHRDPLTDALNRRGFEAAAEPLLASGRALALMVVDVDKFKAINDTFGHPAGDRVLQTIVADLLGVVRRDDLIGRLGGDEFAVLLVDVAPGMAAQVADRLRRSVGLDTSPRATVSVGVAHRTAGEPYLSLLARADEQLYAAKGYGGDQVAVATG